VPSTVTYKRQTNPFLYISYDKKRKLKYFNRKQVFVGKIKNKISLNESHPSRTFLIEKASGKKRIFQLRSSISSQDLCL
jgi:hypothetical protein